MWDILRNLLLAARWTVVLSLIAFVGGGLVGLALLVARTTPSVWLQRAVLAYVQLFLAYFGLALLGWDTSAWTSAAVALTLYSSAFLTEIWHGCVKSIPQGQWEAAKSLALNFGEQLRHIILPQAARVAIPPTVGFLVQVVKGTALASVIGFVELTKAGTMITNATFKPFLVYSLVGLLYFALCYPISRYARTLEGRFHAHSH